MKAIVQYEYGSPDVLELRDIEKPVVGDGEVLVRVQAAGVHIGDWLLMNGLPSSSAWCPGCSDQRTMFREVM